MGAARIRISDVKMSTDFLWIKTDRHRLICFCICYQICFMSQNMELNKNFTTYQLPNRFYQLLPSQISGDRNVYFSNPSFKERKDYNRYSLWKYFNQCSLTWVCSWLDSVLISRLGFMYLKIVMSFKLFIYKYPTFLSLNILDPGRMESWCCLI